MKEVTFIRRNIEKWKETEKVVERAASLSHRRIERGLERGEPAIACGDAEIVHVQDEALGALAPELRVATVIGDPRAIEDVASVEEAAAALGLEGGNSHE